MSPPEGTTPDDDTSAASPQADPIGSKNSPTNQPALDENSSLTGEFIRNIDHLVDSGNHEEARRLVAELHPADVADLLEQLDGMSRVTLIGMLGKDLDADTLIELDEDVRDDVIQVMPNQQLATAIAEMETDDAAFVMEDMGAAAREEVFAGMPVPDQVTLRAVLDFEEDTAGRLMQREVFTAPSFWSVGQIIDRLRSNEELPETFYEVFVIDAAFRPVGSVPLSKFLRAPREALIKDLVIGENMRKVPVGMDQEEVAYLFEKYNLISVPVVDDSDRLVGMITVDDVVEIIQEENEEDMLALAGVVSEESGLSASLGKTLRSRFTWLFVNLLTAILASIVISLFGATLEQAVVLAILMPIVASMGGNAGTQTLTVAVRNIATKDITSANTMRVVGREASLAFLNGLAFAVLLGVLAGVWYAYVGIGSPAGTEQGLKLALVLGLAMIITMLSAGLAGILVPIGLHRAGSDPAVSSAVFVTTVTDVVGFFAFLGLAALILV